jgi:hypothetical protein
VVSGHFSLLDVRRRSAASCFPCSHRMDWEAVAKERRPYFGHGAAEMDQSHEAGCGHLDEIEAPADCPAGWRTMDQYDRLLREAATLRQLGFLRFRGNQPSAELRVRQRL